MWFRLPEWKKLAAWLMAGMLLVSGSVMAADNNSQAAQQPYEVQADTAIFDQRQGTGEYLGHVLLTRGDEQLKANKLTLKLDDQKQLTHVRAVGKPVTFSDGVDMQGRADQLVYDIKTRRVRLLGDAFVTQGERQFSGAEIIYALDSKRVQAKGGDGNRVKLVLPPSDTEQAGQQEGGK